MAEAQRELARIGIDRPVAQSVGGPRRWATGELSSFPTGTFADLAQVRHHREVVVLDVRRTDEHRAGSIEGAVNIPIQELPRRVDEVPAGEVWVHCASGYRASVAASFLSAAGRTLVARRRLLRAGRRGRPAPGATAPGRTAEMTFALAIAAGALIGLSLGALGGGGSILAVPVLVYLLGQSPSQATTGSLVVVGVTSLLAAASAHRAGNVLLGRGVVFGVVAIGGAALGAKASVQVSEDVLLAAFAGLMLVVGGVMAGADCDATEDQAQGTPRARPSTNRSSPSARPSRATAPVPSRCWSPPPPSDC